MQVCVNQPGRLDTSITCDDVTVGSQLQMRAKMMCERRLCMCGFFCAIRIRLCVCVAMFLQMFVCPLMSLSVFICKCHNKSSETCLSLFCVHTSHHEWKRLPQSDTSQTACFVHQMEMCCSPGVMMMMVSDDSQILDL